MRCELHSASRPTAAVRMRNIQPEQELSYTTTVNHSISDSSYLVKFVISLTRVRAAQHFAAKFSIFREAARFDSQHGVFCQTRWHE